MDPYGRTSLTHDDKTVCPSRGAPEPGRAQTQRRLLALLQGGGGAGARGGGDCGGGGRGGASDSAASPAGFGSEEGSGRGDGAVVGGDLGEGDDGDGGDDAAAAARLRVVLETKVEGNAFFERREYRLAVRVLRAPPIVRPCLS
jgi:hypothetical protein